MHIGNRENVWWINEISTIGIDKACDRGDWQSLTFNNIQEFITHSQNTSSNGSFLGKLTFNASSNIGISHSCCGSYHMSFHIFRGE